MSFYKHKIIEPSVVGDGAAYRNISELVEDKQQMDLLVEALEISTRKLVKDDCGQWTIFGKSGLVQTATDLSYLIYAKARSKRKWSAIKRNAERLEMAITQDGDQDGCIQLPLPNVAQAQFLRNMLGLRKKPVRPFGSVTNKETSAT